MDGENHASIPYPSLFAGLRYVFADWVLPQEALQQGLAAIDAHYARISYKYGFATTVSENTLNQLGYALLGDGDTGGAIEAFTENTRRYPHSANVYDSLGDAYERAGNLELARDNYSKACERAKTQGHANLPIYQANLERVSER